MARLQPPTRRLVRASTLTTLAAVLALSAAACGADDEGDGDGSEETAVIEIAFSDGEVTPSGERVEVDAGQPVDLEVTADEPGEIHIHAEQEQTLAYEEGTETFELAIDRPGVVEVESHELDVVIVQLEVR